MLLQLIGLRIRLRLMLWRLLAKRALDLMVSAG
jgi:hypothetical protein